MQLRSGTSLGQLRRQVSHRITSLLKRRAAEIRSPALALMARQGDEMAPDAVERIIRMIQEMLPKLESDLNGMEEKKAKCDKELQINNRTRRTQSLLLEKLSTTVGQNGAEIRALGYEVQALRRSLRAASEELAAAAELRRQEKAEHEATVSEARQAQLAVGRAKEVLENVYVKASFLQESSDLAAEMETQASRGHGGLITLLEVLVTDFTELEAKTNEAEETAAEKYQEFKTESKKEVKVKELEIEHKVSRKEALGAEVLQAEKDLKMTEEELQAAKDYYESLKLMCMAATKQEEKEELRQREIAALKEALSLMQ